MNLQEEFKIYYTENYKESINLIGEEVIGCSNPEFEGKCYTGILRGILVEDNGKVLFKIKYESEAVSNIYFKSYIKRINSSPPILPFTPLVDPSKIVGKIVVQKAIHKKYFLVVGMNGNCVKIADEWISFKELFEKYTFLDESPCGEHWLNQCCYEL